MILAFNGRAGTEPPFLFPDVPWCALGVRKVAFIRVAKHDVADFMEEGLHRESRNGADCDLPATLGIALSVAVQILEWYTLDIQGGKGIFFVPFLDDGGLVFRPVGLRQNEPMGLAAASEGKHPPLSSSNRIVFLDRQTSGQRNC